MPKPRGSAAPQKEMWCPSGGGHAYIGHPRSKHCPEHRTEANRKVQLEIDRASFGQTRFLIATNGPGVGKFDHLLLRVNVDKACRSFGRGEIIITTPANRPPVKPHRKVWHKSAHAFPEDEPCFWIIENYGKGAS